MPTHFHAIVWIDHAQAKIFHVGLTVRDTEAALRFYRDALGLELESQGERPGAPGRPRSGRSW